MEESLFISNRGVQSQSLKATTLDLQEQDWTPQSRILKNYCTTVLWCSRLFPHGCNLFRRDVVKSVPEGSRRPCPSLLEAEDPSQIPSVSVPHRALDPADEPAAPEP